ncbi:hypothetical protein J5N97_003869 [Dioscorea zingiberensis]|uniref:Aminotransferase class V domain-containing protein n=1 Tax=Dioscorea zingiberensis TaxID=325984 RepID=A0A9D5D5H5_9LILI|nr:hypothetical protein J5N97_003869 [Dioscorea zingiberensis]
MGSFKLEAWGRVSQRTGASLKYIGLTKEQVPDVDQLKKLLSKKTKLVVTHHVSNTLASVLPIDQIVLWSRDVGAKVLVDACQSVPHMPVDVQKLNADFLVALSHKRRPVSFYHQYGLVKQRAASRIKVSERQLGGAHCGAAGRRRTLGGRDQLPDAGRAAHSRSRREARKGRQAQPLVGRDAAFECRTGRVGVAGGAGPGDDGEGHEPGRRLADQGR